MKLRVAKKILKKQDKLKYNAGQIRKATTLVERHQRRAERKAAKAEEKASESVSETTPEAETTEA